MLLPRLEPPLRVAIASIGRVGPSTNPQAPLSEAFAQLSVCRTGTRFGDIRHASHKAQGAVNKAKDGPGKRLGAKKSGGTSVCSK
jgi:large subunit ribosomal protein L27